MELVLASAIVSMAAILAWLGGLMRGRSSTAEFRYKVTMLLLAYGIASIPVVLAYLFLGLEYGFVTWGGPDNLWIAIAIVSAVLAIATSAILGLANVILLRLPTTNFHPKGGI